MVSLLSISFFFFFNDTATTEIYTLSLHDALPILLFWLRAADTMAAEDRADTFDDLKYYTEQIAPALESGGINLLATNADTVYVALPNHTRRAILLSGLDYPYGYLLIDPGGPERILTGVYSDDDLLEELRVYFDLPDDTASAQPRVAT